MNWNHYFEYKDGELYWKVDRYRRKLTGKRAGYLQKDGYRSVGLDKKLYQEHIIIWEMFNGPVPNGFNIDHKNKNRSHNFLSNLRLATRLDNSANVSLSVRNSTGFKGVSFINSIKKYEAKITRNKKRLHLGYFSTAEAASEVYEAKAKELAGEFYYANNH